MNDPIRSEAEALADEMFSHIDPYEPAPAIWREIRDYVNTIMSEADCEYLNISTLLVTHDTKPSILESFDSAFLQEFALVKAFLVIGFAMKKSPNDPNTVRQAAVLLLDDNRKAYAFHSGPVAQLQRGQA